MPDARIAPMMVTSSPRQPVTAAAPPQRQWLWPILAGALTFGLYLLTLQWGINGSQSAYATDVGELQNALPRWGTIHFTGYPLYTFLGSLFVTLLRPLGIAPAAGASLYSAAWGALAIAWLAALAQDLDVPGPIALLSSLVAALALSHWVDGSIAEVHALTMVWVVASLQLALRYDRTGARPDLLWLTFAFTQGVAHQRAVAFMAPALLVLVYPRWRDLWRHGWAVLGVALLAPLTYLYLPLRAWQGAEWTFNAPGTWRGFWTMIGDTKSGRIVSIPGSLGELLDRVSITITLLRDDLPSIVLSAGGLGLLAPLAHKRWRLVLSTLLVVIVHLAIALVVWEGRVSDALLAVKLPAVYMAALGLGLWATLLPKRQQVGGWAVSLSLALVCAVLYVRHIDQVRDITRDASAEQVIAAVEAIDTAGERPIAFMALWGHDYWALTYAKAYRDQLSGLDLYDHNGDFAGLLSRGVRLMTLDRSLYQRPMGWWAERLGRVHLSSPAPGIVEIATAPLRDLPELIEGDALDLGNGVEIAHAELRWDAAEALRLDVVWRAPTRVPHDYSVAVHLLAHFPPSGAQDILAQADRQHPVGGWYPTTRWATGEIVPDSYLLAVPAGAAPVAVRLGMYRQIAAGQFENTEWLVLPVP